MSACTINAQEDSTSTTYPMKAALTAPPQKIKNSHLTFASHMFQLVLNVLLNKKLTPPTHTRGHCRINISQQTGYWREFSSIGDSPKAGVEHKISLSAANYLTWSQPLLSFGRFGRNARSMFVNTPTCTGKGLKDPWRPNINLYMPKWGSDA